MQHTCTPISSAALSTATNKFSTPLGSGATGEVFSGTLPNGAAIAVKRLRAPADAPPAVLDSLRRRFRAELATLSAFQHPRIVRLLHVCEAEGDPVHPFLLVFELLDGGSLADWLRSPTGGAAVKGILTPLQRIDAALGIAHGLKYLHGQREAGEEGSQAPVVHRDVKSANVGFSSQRSGELYAKVIDCGLAKALRGGGGAAAAAAAGGGGASFSAGILGTPGYMAPEVADGLYTVASEVYSFGVVLLELLQGQCVQPSTASEARESAEDDGVGRIEALAEAVWPQPAAAAMAKLVMDCTLRKRQQRPQSMLPVVASLQYIRALLTPPRQRVACPVCFEEEVEEADGLRCTLAPPAEGHFCCRGCLQLHVSSKCEVPASLAGLTARGGRIPCVQAGCAALWTIDELAASLDKGTFVVLTKCLAYALYRLPEIKREEARRAEELEQEASAAAAALAAAHGAAARQAALTERVRILRAQIVERELTPHCPRCGTAFVDFVFCAALECVGDGGHGGCGANFCAYCQQDCGMDAHAHVLHAHAGLAGVANPLFPTAGEFQAAMVPLRCNKVAEALVQVAGEGLELQEALLAELAVADLPGVNVEAAAVRAAAGMPPLQQQQQQQQHPPVQQQEQEQEQQQQPQQQPLQPRQRQKPLVLPTAAMPPHEIVISLLHVQPAAAAEVCEAAAAAYAVMPEITQMACANAGLTGALAPVLRGLVTGPAKHVWREPASLIALLGLCCSGREERESEELCKCVCLAFQHLRTVQGAGLREQLCAHGAAVGLLWWNGLVRCLRRFSRSSSVCKYLGAALCECLEFLPSGKGEQSNLRMQAINEALPTVLAALDFCRHSKEVCSRLCELLGWAAAAELLRTPQDIVPCLAMVVKAGSLPCAKQGPSGSAVCRCAACLLALLGYNPDGSEKTLLQKWGFSK